MLEHSFLETGQPARCQRCGGQLIRSWGEIDCLQCGAIHTAEGKLLTYYAQESGLNLVRRRQRRSFGSYKKKQLSQPIAATSQG
ncbi:MAG: hypothetical protein HYU85_06055 [Chloroflexi bacterium]|nr:hypothetical protein [Chloroflexota bacterium]